MAIIRSFRDLKVYQWPRQEAQRIFRLSQSLHEPERRAPSRLVVGTESRLAEAVLGAPFRFRVTASQHRDHDAAWQFLGGMINNTIEKADDFCKNVK